MNNGWINDNIFPGIAAGRARKILTAKSIEVNNKDVDISNVADITTTIQKIELELKSQMDRKKVVDDKAKSVLGGIAIAMTAITFALNSQQIYFGNIVNLVAILALIVAIFFFIMATVRAIQSLILRPYQTNELAYNVNTEIIELTVEQDQTRRLNDLVKAKIFNDYAINDVNNYVYAAYVLFRNGIISVSVFFIFSIFEKGIDSRKINKKQTAIVYSLKATTS